jgi:AhpD family alkylhydroperoxidase
MGRLTTIDPAQATGKVKEIFEGPLKGKTFNLFKAMANSPAALEAYLGLSGKEREIIQLTIGEANNCGYCVAAHTAIGKGLGLSEAQTIEARRGKLTDPKLNALTRFTLAVHEKKGFVSSEDLAAFKSAGYNDGHVAEVVAGYALAVYTNTFNHLNETAIDFPAPPKI